jgi:hypothetical protein
METLPHGSKVKIFYIFINGRGLNPFAQHQWVPIKDVEIMSNASDYSDISVWKDDASNMTDDDPDGPEYNSDYDFDAESGSGSESDDGGPTITGKTSVEDQFYNERWSGLTTM